MTKAATRKHHYVSAFLLRGFAEDGHFTQVPLDGSAPHVATASSTGWLRDSHRASPLEADPDTYEKAQTVFVESPAAPLVSRLNNGDDSVLEEPQREILEKLLILHHQRHPAMMKHVTGETAPEFEGYRHVPGIDAAFRAFLAQAVSFTADLDAMFMPEMHDRVKARWAQYRRVLDEFTWNVVRYDDPSLLFGDMLVCPSRLAPGRTHDEREYGWGIGLMSAERVTVALTPTTGLLLSRGDRVRRLIPEAFNRSTIGCATMYVLYPGSWPTRNPRVFSNAAGILGQRGANVSL
ncbi:DUF4238 domain-containing protein [Microbacterium arborescens]|uniref:DUF4238 domain-containing protein n=1 Tax=Microbacterium arborescens TaxID=33883 RepID=UPI003C7382AD